MPKEWIDFPSNSSLIKSVTTPSKLTTTKSSLVGVGFHTRRHEGRGVVRGRSGESHLSSEGDVSVVFYPTPFGDCQSSTVVLNVLRPHPPLFGVMRRPTSLSPLGGFYVPRRYAGVLGPCRDSGETSSSPVLRVRSVFRAKTGKGRGGRRSGKLYLS